MFGVVWIEAGFGQVRAQTVGAGAFIVCNEGSCHDRGTSSIGSMQEDLARF